MVVRVGRRGWGWNVKGAVHYILNTGLNTGGTLENHEKDVLPILSLFTGKHPTFRERKRDRMVS